MNEAFINALINVFCFNFFQNTILPVESVCINLSHIALITEFLNKEPSEVFDQAYFFQIKMGIIRFLWNLTQVDTGTVNGMFNSTRYLPVYMYT